MFSETATGACRIELIERPDSDMPPGSPVAVLAFVEAADDTGVAGIAGCAAARGVAPDVGIAAVVVGGNGIGVVVGGAGTVAGVTGCEVVIWVVPRDVSGTAVRSAGCIPGVSLRSNTGNEGVKASLFFFDRARRVSSGPVRRADVGLSRFAIPSLSPSGD